MWGLLMLLRALARLAEKNWHKFRKKRRLHVELWPFPFLDKRDGVEMMGGMGIGSIMRDSGLVFLPDWQMIRFSVASVTLPDWPDCYLPDWPDWR